MHTIDISSENLRTNMGRFKSPEVGESPECLWLNKEVKFRTHIPSLSWWIVMFIF